MAGPFVLPPRPMWTLWGSDRAATVCVFQGNSCSAAAALRRADCAPRATARKRFVAWGLPGCRGGPVETVQRPLGTRRNSAASGG